MGVSALWNLQRIRFHHHPSCSQADGGSNKYPLASAPLTRGVARTLQPYTALLSVPPVRTPATAIASPPYPIARRAILARSLPRSGGARGRGRTPARQETPAPPSLVSQSVTRGGSSELYVRGSGLERIFSAREVILLYVQWTERRISVYEPDHSPLYANGTVTEAALSSTQPLLKRTLQYK